MRTLSNFRLQRHTALLFLYLASLPLGHAQIAAGTFSIADGGQQKRFAIAEDELYCTPRDGSAAHFKQLDAAADPPTAVSRAARQNASSDDQYDLVLYPDGATRCRSNRRILRRKLLVELFDRDAAKKIYAQSRAIAYQIPKYAPDFVILEFAAAGDSLEQLGAVRALAGVKSANPLLAKYRNKRSTPNDPLLLYSATNPGYQWHLKNSGANGGIAGIDVNIEPLWDRYSGAGVTVGVVDDGLQLDHPDLAANTNNNLHKDWNGADNDPSPESEDTHGTPCAGVVAAVAGNQQGGAGAAPQAQLVGLRLIAAAVSDQQEAEAMNWETAQAILIKSNSWGPNDAEGELEAAGPLVQSAFIDSTRNGRGGRGTVHVWAAGNGGDDDNVNYDGYANSIYTIAIGAVNDKGQRSGYSEPGAAKVVSAPSDGDFDDQGITTTDINSNYRYDFGGTSSATPLAAGVIALMLEANPDLGWRDVQEILIRCARQLRPDDAGWHLNAAKIPFSHDFGAGLIDAALAIELAEDWTNLGAQQSITLTDSAPLAIPDQDSAGVEKTFTIEANDSFRVEHVSLTVDIAHQDRSNLTISLISPGGTESVLALPQETFANKANYDNWTFMTVHNWGEQAAGSWTLKVVDSVHGNAGILNTATLQVYGASNPAPQAPSIHWAQGVRGLVGRSFYLKALAPQGVVTYQASNLPAGLSLNTQTGAISGTPTASGAFPVTLAATNPHGSTAATFDLHIDALEINSALHATAVTDRSFSYQIQGSDSPTAFSAAGLPDGLSVDVHNGLISGVPTQIGSFLITLGASNASGSAVATLALNVIEGASLSYGTALDNELQTFDAEPLDAEPLWINQSAVSADGIDALQSPAIAHSQSTAFSTTVHASGVLEFYAKTSTEADYDLLEVTVDGARLLELSGAHEWKKYSYNLINNSTQKSFGNIQKTAITVTERIRFGSTRSSSPPPCSPIQLLQQPILPDWIGRRVRIGVWMRRPPMTLRMP